MKAKRGVALASVLMMGIPSSACEQKAKEHRSRSNLGQRGKAPLVLAREMECEAPWPSPVPSSIQARAAFIERGLLAVGDQQSKEVLLLKDSVVVSRFGGDGDGPGEFASLDWVGVVGDSLLAVGDRVRRRVAFFRRNGDFAGAVGPETPAGERIVPTGLGPGSQVLGFVARVPGRIEEGAPYQESRTFWLSDHSGASDSIATVASRPFVPLMLPRASLMFPEPFGGDWGMEFAAGKFWKYEDSGLWIKTELGGEEWVRVLLPAHRIAIGKRAFSEFISDSLFPLHRGDEDVENHLENQLDVPDSVPAVRTWRANGVGSSIIMETRSDIFWLLRKEKLEEIRLGRWESVADVLGDTVLVEVSNELGLQSLRICTLSPLRN